MISPELEVRIKELCKETLSAEERHLESVIQELRAALHEHNELLKNLVEDGLSRPPPQSRSLTEAE